MTAPISSHPIEPIKQTKSTKWASRVRKQPSVNTLNMKSMATLGQQSELILSLKLTQTNSTVKRVFDTHDRFVRKNRECVNERLINAAVVEVEQLAQLPL